MAKQRLDVLLVEKNLAASRERAKSMIMAGLVLADGQKVEKAGMLVKAEAKIRILGDNMPYVSRGGLKLAKAIEVFRLNIAGKVVADIGASTGGFTDCALQNGARKVYAIDVGYGQLAWKLRTDERVVNMERTNARYLTPDMLPEPPDMASIDVAFISLSKVLPTVKSLLRPEGEIVALIKPQFEAGRDKVGKKGVVREAATHVEVIRRVAGFSQEIDGVPAGLTYSPVRGPEGNIEYLVHILPANSGGMPVTEEEISQTVQEAHLALDK